MSDLRDEVESQLVQYAIRMESPIISSTITSRFTDAILAAVADALTSDEAVDAMLYRSYGWADYDEGTTYLDLPEDEKADIRDMGRNEIGAALEAVGIMKGDDDE